MRTGHKGKGPRGYQRNDQLIFEDVCELLTSNPHIDARKIDVQVKEGCVYLAGEVPDRQTKKLAELEIEKISGLKDIQNLLNFQASENDYH